MLVTLSQLKEKSLIFTTRALKNLQDSDTSKPRTIFSCAFRYTKDGELTVSKGRLLKLADDKCMVYGEAVNGMIFITFNTSESPSPWEGSRRCLEKALASKDSCESNFVHS